MTDKEIMLGIKYCHDKEAGCDYCPYAIYLAKDCDTNLMKDAIDLINRQQAEIDRLKKYNTDVAYKHYDDGIKEFAERFKEIAGYSIASIDGRELYETKHYGIMAYDFDNLVKEMVGAEDE